MAPLSFEPPRMDVAKEARAPYRALIELGDSIELDPPLRELINLRASILNGCAYCVDMHTKDARAAGETEQRLFAVPVWRETPFFTPRERAGLAWAEAVTEMPAGGVSDEVYHEARGHFSESEIVQLTMAVIAINGWNRLAVAFRSDVGGYQPRKRSDGAGSG
jgi:AhpD family alkylhydroperoxidase